jgi:hypothetical protein
MGALPCRRLVARLSDSPETCRRAKVLVLRVNGFFIHANATAVLGPRKAGRRAFGRIDADQ